MKLARTAFVVVRNDDLRRESRHIRRSARPSVPRIVAPRPATRQLIAAWRVDPLTDRLECRWSAEAAPADDQGPLSRINAARRHRALYRRR